MAATPRAYTPRGRDISSLIFASSSHCLNPLQNYLPLPTQPRLTTLTRKRREYSQLVKHTFSRGLGGLDQQVRGTAFS